MCSSFGIQDMPDLINIAKFKLSSGSVGPFILSSELIMKCAVGDGLLRFIVGLP